MMLKHYTCLLVLISILLSGCNVEDSSVATNSADLSAEFNQDIGTANASDLAIPDEADMPEATQDEGMRDDIGTAMVIDAGGVDSGVIDLGEPQDGGGGEQAQISKLRIKNMRSDEFLSAYGPNIASLVKPSGGTQRRTNVNGLQRAIDSASPGDTIVITNSSGSPRVNVNKRLNIVAQNLHQATFTNGTEFKISAKGVVVYGLRFNGVRKDFEVAGENAKILAMRGDKSRWLKVSASGAEVAHNEWVGDIFMNLSPRTVNHHIHHNLIRNYSGDGNLIQFGWQYDKRLVSGSVKSVIEYNMWRDIKKTSEPLAMKSGDNLIINNIMIDVENGHFSNRSGDNNFYIGNVHLGAQNNAFRVFDKHNAYYFNYLGGAKNDAFTISHRHYFTDGRSDTVRYNESTHTTMRYNVLSEVPNYITIDRNSSGGKVSTQHQPVNTVHKDNFYLQRQPPSLRSWTDRNNGYSASEYNKDNPQGGFDGNYLFKPVQNEFVSELPVTDPFATPFTVEKAFRDGKGTVVVDPTQIHWIKAALVVE